MIRHGGLGGPARNRHEPEWQLPAGSELLLASVLGIVGWWGLVQAVLWLAR